MNNPSPVPLLDFATNFVNSLGIISGSIPGPLSVTLTRALPSSSFSISALIVILPCVVNLTALSIRLEITWVKRFLSSST